MKNKAFNMIHYNDPSRMWRKIISSWYCFIYHIMTKMVRSIFYDIITMLRRFIWHKFKKILKNWSVMFFHSYLSNVYGILDILRWRFFKAKMFILNEVFHVCTANLTRKILRFWSGYYEIQTTNHSVTTFPWKKYQKLFEQ